MFGSAQREYDPRVKAIVLVGGEGTRLRPLTLRTPKQLVPVLGRPLLLHLLEHLRDHGFDRITLAMTRTTGSAAVYAHFEGDAPAGIELSFVFEDSPLGSGGAIANAAAGWAADSEPFLVCNGDLVTNLDLSSLFAFHRERESAVTIALHAVEDPTAFGVVAIEDDGRIARFVEKPPRDEAPSNLVNAGFWVFDPAVVAELDATRFNRVEDVLFPALAQQRRGLYGMTPPGYWRDVGYPDAYREANLALLGNEEDEEAAASTLLVGPGTVLADTAIAARSVLGAGCTIESGATISESVLWDGVRVGRGATVHRSVIASGANIEGGAQLEGAVVGHGATVPAGLRLVPGARVEPGDRADFAGAAASV